MSCTAVDPEGAAVDLERFRDPAHPQSWSRQMHALLQAGHYRQAYDVLAEKVPYVENQLRPYLQRLAGEENHWTLTHAWIARELDLTAPRRILDVGCAIGCHALELAGSGHQCWGMDILPAMIARGRELAESLGLGERVHLIAGDIRRLGTYFEAGFFDAAVACDIFEHLDDAALLEVLAGLRQVLRPGGRLVVQTSPGRYYYWFEPDRKRLLGLLVPLAWLPDGAFTAYVRWLDRWLMQRVRGEPPAFYRHEHGHINCMDPVHLRGLLERAGLEQVRTFAVHAHLGFKEEGCRRVAFTRRVFGRKSIAARNVFGTASVPSAGSAAQAEACGSLARAATGIR